MGGTKVMACFSIVGDAFPLERITEELGLEPTETFVKGDLIGKSGPASSKTRKRMETDWTLSTGFQQSNDINDQLTPLLNSLAGKQTCLIQLKKEFGLTYLFIIVIDVENIGTPVMVLEKNIIDFASAIEAEIHFDLYVNNEGDLADAD